MPKHQVRQSESEGENAWTEHYEWLHSIPYEFMKFIMWQNLRKFRIYREWILKHSIQYRQHTRTHTYNSVELSWFYNERMHARTHIFTTANK